MHLRALKAFVASAFLLSCNSSVFASELHEAARRNDLDAATEILEHTGPSDINGTINNGVTALHIAAALNHRDMTAILIKHGARMNAHTGIGATPLHWAASQNAQDTAELLIWGGANLNCCTRTGITPLHWAAFKNSRQIADLLIKSGADINARTRNGATASQLAMFANADDVLWMISDHSLGTDIEAFPRHEAVGVYAPEGEDPPPDRFSIRLGGGKVRNKASISFETTASVTAADVVALVAPQYKGGGGDIGDLTAHADRDYDDGYVRQDAGTPIWGDTWYWGYDDSDQVESDSIFFHTHGGIYSTDTGTDASFSRQWSTDTLVDENSYFQLDFILTPQSSLCYGITISGSQASFSASDHSSKDWHLREKETIDEYELGGFTPPSAPYQGDEAGPGFVIANTPDNRTAVTRDIKGAKTEITESLDIEIATTSLGAFIECRPWCFYLLLAAGVSVHDVETDASRHEVLYRGTTSVLQTWADTRNTEDRDVGMFGQCEIGIRPFRILHLGFFGRYDSVADIDGTVGSSKYHAEFNEIHYGAKAGLEL